MPVSCCAVGCTNRKTGENAHKPFYSIPAKKDPFSQNRREAWIKAIKRDDWKNWSYDQISRAVICGDHFISGKRSDNADDPNFVPTIFAHTSAQELQKSSERKRRHERYQRIDQKRRKCLKPESTATDTEQPTTSTFVQNENNEAALQHETAIKSNTQATQCDTDYSLEISQLKKQIQNLNSELQSRNEEIYKLREENNDLKTKLKPFGFNTIKHSDDLVNFYTGLASLEAFLWVVDGVRDKIQVSHSRLSVEDHVLIVYMKLRLGLLHKDLALRFGLQTKIITNIYRTVLPLVASSVQNLIVWPDKSEIRTSLPVSFHRRFRNAVCTIDCSEIFIERPSNLTARAKTWSNYKHHNTMKYLIGITPGGAISFLSQGWGGRASDKHITIESGFLRKISPGDCVLADRGFLISKELAECGGILKIPAFTKGKKQLSAKEVDESRQLAHIRIHVERVIGRMKNFKLLQTVIPVSQVDMLNHAMVTISASVNLNNSVVK